MCEAVLNLTISLIVDEHTGCNSRLPLPIYRTALVGKPGVTKLRHDAQDPLPSKYHQRLDDVTMLTDILPPSSTIMALPSESVPPPTYSDRDEPANGIGPQILIAPTHSTLNFQHGYLGAEDEHVVLEGEVQIKGAAIGDWDSVCVFLYSFINSYALLCTAANSYLI